MFCAFSTAHAEGIDAWLVEINSMVSSLKIATMQSGVISDGLSNNKIQASQAAAAAAAQLQNREQVRKVWDEFGPTGQLIEPCYQLAMADTTAQIKGKADSSAANAASLVYRMSDDGMVSGGMFSAPVQRSAVPFAASQAKRLARHREKYCSVSEASAGYCTLQPNGMQSGDADFSLLYAPGQTYGWDQAEAATDFVKTVAPVRPMPVATGCSTPTCAAAVRANRDEEAYVSMARFSFLRFVESRSSQAAGDAKVATK